MTKKDNQKVKFTSESYISMALGALVIIVVGILTFNAFKAETQKEKLGEGEVITGEKITAEEETFPSDTHKVVVGENLWSIAEKYFESGYDWVDIAEANNLFNPDHIEIGQELIIPKAEKKLTEFSISEENYTVTEADTLWNIAVRAYGDGFTWTKIAEANNLANPNIIHVGNVLKLPR